jgi:hypothetical protein
MFELGYGTTRNCEGMSRRDVLKIGSLGLFGLGLPGVLQAQAAAAAAGKPKDDVNVILIWLDGGPSHIDMFDPKPEAPSEVRGEFGAIETNVKGVRISDQLPKLAKVTDKYSILRGAFTPDAGHGTGNNYLQTGYRFNPIMTYPCYGAVYGREKGMRNGMPAYSVVGGIPAGASAGYIGASWNPFNVGGDPNAENFSVQDVSPPNSVKSERISRRRSALEGLDTFQRQTEATQRPLLTTDAFYSKAFDLITSPVAKKAFDLKQEDAKLRESYGKNTFGQGCLLARRMIEAGTRFVTVNRGGWDTHTSNFQSLKGSRLPELDQGYSELLTDLSDRGMLSNTMVICMGEFGRTPKVNSSAGRDHWAGSCYITLGGGPIKMGQVIGESDETASNPKSRPVSIEDFAATVYKALGINTDTIYHTADTRPVRVLESGEPVHELF